MIDKDYFEHISGRGILATADADGRVDAAVYARPHITEEGHLAFVMNDRLTHANLQSNPHAAFLFIEDGPRLKGRRFLMTRVREDHDADLIASLRRRKYPAGEEEQMKPLVAVFFSIDKELPLVGTEQG